jgi:hypothetical protein
MRGMPIQYKAKVTRFDDSFGITIS